MKTVLQSAGGVSTVIGLEDGNLVTGTVQDCTPIVERAQALHNAGRHGSADMRHAATLPMVVIEKYCNDHGITFDEWMRDRVHIRRMLNDRSLSFFRVWPGQV